MYTFKKFNKRLDLQNGISVNTHNINIGKPIYKELGNPKRLMIEYDLDAKVIKLTPTTSEKERKVCASSNGYLISTTHFWKLIGVGKFERIDKGLFKLRS